MDFYETINYYFKQTLRLREMMKTAQPHGNDMNSSPPPSPPAHSEEANPRLRRRGILLMVGAGFCWSTGGILVRKVGTPDSWEIVLWRSVFMVLFLFAVLSFWHGKNVFAKIAGVGFQGALSGFFLASTFFFFILSVTRNTVANTLVLMSTGPFFVAFFGRIFLTERIPPRTWIAIGVALSGITLMFSEGLDKGQSLGNFLALGVPTAFSLNIIILRRAKAHVDMVPSVMLAGIFSILIALPLAWPLAPTLHDLTVLGIMGCIQLGTGCLLMTIATRYLAAGEVGLLALLETTLGPIWVWLGIGERPTDLALIGGVIVIAALLINEWLGFRENRTT
jgi:drug/metabolite transporter (DMT)-like permease